MELRKKILIGAFSTATAIVGGVGLKIYGDYNWSISEGDRSGVVTKFSHKKSNWYSPCPSWEGELAMDNFARGSGIGNKTAQAQKQSISNTFAFSVQDEKVVKLVEEAQRTGNLVNLEYQQTKTHMACFRDTDYLITAVKPLAPKP